MRQDERERFLNFLDMIDGGGRGQAGDQFEGGPLSGLLNMLGVRPRGYEDRQNQPTMSPQMRPPMGLGEFTPPIETRRPDGIGATPATAYTGPAVAPNPTPASTYDDAYMSYLRNMLTPQSSYDEAGIYGAPTPMMNNPVGPMGDTRRPMTPQDFELIRYIYGMR